MATTRKTTAKRTSATKTAPAFTDEERGAMKERAKEVKAAKRGEDGTTAVLDKIAEMEGDDRDLAERVHRVVMAAAPDLEPRLWYGMPAYAKGGKTLCFFQPATKFKTRYSTLGFNDPSALDDGAMWPVAYALTSLSAADEKKVTALIRKAVG
jgi:uncharacterized protein YdhG (YjbR/CyaY superfamily)